MPTLETEVTGYVFVKKILERLHPVAVCATGQIVADGVPTQDPVGADRHDRVLDVRSGLVLVDAGLDDERVRQTGSEELQRGVTKLADLLLGPRTRVCVAWRAADDDVRIAGGRGPPATRCLAFPELFRDQLSGQPQAQARRIVQVLLRKDLSRRRQQSVGVAPPVVLEESLRGAQPSVIDIVTEQRASGGKHGGGIAPATLSDQSPPCLEQSAGRLVAEQVDDGYETGPRKGGVRTYRAGNVPGETAGDTVAALDSQYLGPAGHFGRRIAIGCRCEPFVRALREPFRASWRAVSPRAA